MRRTVKELFNQVALDHAGVIYKQDFKTLLNKMRKDSSLPDIYAELDVDRAWAKIPKVRGAQELRVNFRSFEDWWQRMAGIQDPDVPVGLSCVSLFFLSHVYISEMRQKQPSSRWLPLRLKVA